MSHLPISRRVKLRSWKLLAAFG